MAKYAVSLVIIALNEEAKIARCIESAKWVDEVIVVDSGSTDQTRELAKKLGARVVVEKWRGFQQQKVFACGLASHDWILSLDADEALSPELSSTLKTLCSGVKTTSAARTTSAVLRKPSMPPNLARPARLFACWRAAR